MDIAEAKKCLDTATAEVIAAYTSLVRAQTEIIKIHPGLSDLPVCKRLAEIVHELNTKISKEVTKVRLS